MGRKSRVDRLPPTLRTEIIRLFDSGRTLDEIMKTLQLLDSGVSRSSLGRYKQKTDQLAARMREQRAMAEVIVASRRTDLDSKAARLNVHLLNSVITDIVAAAEGGAMKPGDAQAIAKALSSLAQVEKNDADLVIKLRAEVKAEADAEARAQLEGLLPENIARSPREMTTDELRQAIKNAIKG